ncbi:hypothetical protein D1839_14055 [Roseburia sp. 1XD42-34]|nr:hypothetical protein [Roseburia sp. 1XD42-34]RKI76595.1 hypothetical protein D7V87_12845 [Clostridium sp. 1xD42-85]
MKKKFSSKPPTNELEDENEYCRKVMDVIESEETISEYPKVKEKLNLLYIEHLRRGYKKFCINDHFLIGKYIHLHKTFYALYKNHTLYSFLAKFLYT